MLVKSNNKERKGKFAKAVNTNGVNGLVYERQEEENDDRLG